MNRIFATESGKDIIDATSGLARRMNMYNIWWFASVYALWGAGVAVVFISVSKFVAIAIPSVLAVVSVLVISLLIGVLRGLLARISPLEAATMADAQLGLKERLSSAVELLGGRVDGSGLREDISEMAELQLEDAANYARSLDPRAICPRVFPVTAKVLPFAILVLIFLIYIPPLHGQPAEVPAEVRQAVEQAGTEIETTAGEIGENVLSDEITKLASELKDKPLTKKESLKKLSNLARKVEAMRMMGELTEELKGEMTPEKERILRELLKKLADNLKDIRDMEEFFRKVLEAQQANLSEDALKDLAAALERMNIQDSDMKALKKMAEQLAKSKRDIGQSILRSPIETGGSKPTDMKAEEESGLMGSGAPGKKALKDMKEEIELPSQRQPSQGAGYDSELEGQFSEEGRSVTTETRAEPEKGDSIVPYEEIYVKYRDAADDAISRPTIPWIYKERVRNYFDAIKPKGEAE